MKAPGYKKIPLILPIEKFGWKIVLSILLEECRILFCRIWAVRAFDAGVVSEHLMGINKKGQHRLHLYLTFLTYHLLEEVKLLNKTTVFVRVLTLVKNPGAYGTQPTTSNLSQAHPRYFSHVFVFWPTFLHSDWIYGILKLKHNNDGSCFHYCVISFLIFHFITRIWNRASLYRNCNVEC